MTPARTLALALAALAMGGGCSLWVDDQLRQASAKLAAAHGGGAGEGEGEGEGEGASEGEGEGAVDPACEDRERLVVVTSDPENPLVVYKLVPGGLVALAPTGFTQPDGKLLTEAGDSAANVEGAVFSAADDLFYLVDADRYYAVDGHTLVQTDVRPAETAVAAGGFPSFHGVAVTPRYIVGAGNGLLGLDRQGAVASSPVELEGSGFFHGAITFTRDGVRFVAGNSEHGYQVLTAADDSAQPQPSNGADDDNRFGDFGGAQARRGLAYDAATGSLLLGNDTGVIVPKASAGFSLPGASTDYPLPHGSFVDAIGARAGKGYVADESGDVYEIDLSASPPTTVEVASWNPQTTSAVPQQIVVGCKRTIVVLGGFGGPTILSYDRATLDAYGGGPTVPDIIDAILVDKNDLALTGDP